MNTRFPIPIFCRSPLCRALTYLLVVGCTAAGLRADFRKSAEFALQSTPDSTKPDSPPPPPTEQAVPPVQGGTYRVGGGVSPPRVIYKKDPGYSEAARKAHLWGTIVLQVIVGAGWPASRY
jgi:hypothetical protein